MKKIISTVVSFSSLYFFLPSLLPVLADPTTEGCAADYQNTAIGCIPIGAGVGGLPTGLLNFILQWTFGISGGVIILMLIMTGYALVTSSGNPEKLQAVKENIVSIFSGVLLIVFSVVLLRAVGADVLLLPTFK